MQCTIRSGVPLDFPSLAIRPMAHAVGCPKFLRCGHARALSESVRDFLPWGWKRAAQRPWQGMLPLLGFLTRRLLAIVALLFSLALVVGGSLATLYLFRWNVLPPDGSLPDAGFHYEFSGLEWCDSEYVCCFVGRETGVVESSDRKADLMPLSTFYSFQFVALRSRLSGCFGCVQLASCFGG